MTTISIPLYHATLRLISIVCFAIAVFWKPKAFDLVALGLLAWVLSTGPV